MSVVDQDKPLRLLKDEVIDQLVLNYSHGKLSLEAFERRLDDAMAAEDHQRLIDLTTDLELDVDNHFLNQKESYRKQYYENVSVEENDLFINIFGGSDRKGIWNVGKKVRTFNLFGGGTLDLSLANFTHSKTYIEDITVFGGGEIYVPENVNIVCQVFCIFGGLTNKAESVSDPSAPTLIIRGAIIFGGLDIKVKKRFKERLMQFAQGLKSFM
ncbi:MAG: LiaF domain-containing protein [Pseudomonadota bacterium]